MDGTAIWTAPLILLPGVALLILSTSTRIAQVHDELLHQVKEAPSEATCLLCERSRLLHSALVCLYIGVGVLAFSSLIGTFTADSRLLAWIPQVIVFHGVVSIASAAFQLIRESRLVLSTINEKLKSPITHKL